MFYSIMRERTLLSNNCSYSCRMSFRMYTPMVIERNTNWQIILYFTLSTYLFFHLWQNKSAEIRSIFQIIILYQHRLVESKMHCKYYLNTTFTAKFRYVVWLSHFSWWQQYWKSCTKTKFKYLKSYFSMTMQKN